ncbi:hypothetical protein AKJ45_03045 [candidate division MSBL1 archaeon SCGC-AAA261F19]|uniref:Uncharacterized protein n=2 Tax=candidate division MSBL1 TaxID=215777 RepID=A0A133V920_9EURY|nr:hypothetical protein AKJ43_01035 [candidate division MSBL1 archaeon SCGC-AAA261D19]KXB02941.1 hypothetical protein AKJ45_03045 [candidate division MSBL1 archaeon SCGC-AAA261F19]
MTEDIREFSDFIASEESAGSRIIRKYCDLCNLMSQEEILCDLHTETTLYLKVENCDFCLVRDTRT